MPFPRRRPMRAAVATLFVPFVLAAGTLTQSAHASVAAQPVMAAPAQKANAAFAAWADQFAADAVRLNPQLATRTQYFSGAEQAALDRELTPLTAAQRAKEAALRRTGVARLRQWIAGPLDATQRVSAAVMLRALENEIANEPFDDYRFVFNQMSGVHISLVQFMTEFHPLRRAADVPAYLARLEQVPARIDEAIARERAAAAKSLLPPRFIIERAQAQVDTFLKPAADANVLVTALAERRKSVV